MESLLRQGKQVCPFLKRSSPTTLRMLATSYSTSSRGYRVSGLQKAATHCPVIGKALAVQQSKRNYVAKSEKVTMTPSHPGLAESVSLEEVHRAAGVTDLTKGITSERIQVNFLGTCPHAEAARKAHGLKFDAPTPFDYEAFYANELDKKHKDKSYRYFNNINRVYLGADKRYANLSLLENFRMLIQEMRVNVFVSGERMTTWECLAILSSSTQSTALSTVTAVEQVELVMYRCLNRTFD
jgi:hypothetical protein